MAYCPHCKRDGIAPSHVDRCPDNPPVNAAIRAALTDPTNTAYAIGSTRYGMIAAACGVPAETTLVIHYGSWGAAVAAFGLLRASEKPRTSNARARNQPTENTAPCRHCGAHYRIGAYLDKHELTCLLRPEILQAVRVLAEDVDNPGVGVDSIIYDRRRIEYNATKPESAPLLPAPWAYRRRFGEWVGLLHHFGLVTREEAADAKAAADNARYKREWQEHHARELDPWGLPIGDDDPTKTNYKPVMRRDLPGVYVNGKPCQVITLR